MKTQFQFGQCVFGGLLRISVASGRRFARLGELASLGSIVSQPKPASWQHNCTFNRGIDLKKSTREAITNQVTGRYRQRSRLPPGVYVVLGSFLAGTKVHRS